MAKMTKTTPTFNFENNFWEKGYLCVGMDEVGRGSFAGPVVTAGVIFTPFCKNLDTRINDSKKLSPKIRNELTPHIKSSALCYAISAVSVQIINRIGIGKATNMAFRKTIETISKKIENDKLFLLVDGFY